VSRQVFTLPDLGEGLTEAELVRWLVAVGDAVAVDAPVAEVETAKAVVEVPSPYAGTIAELHGEEGTTLAVGAPLITVEDGAAGGAGDGAGETYRREERAGSGNVLVGYGTAGAAARSRRRRGGAADQRPRPAPDRGAARPAVKSPSCASWPARTASTWPPSPGPAPTGSSSAATSRPRSPRHRTDHRTDHRGVRSPSDRDARTGLPVRARVPLTGVRRAVAETLTRSRREIRRRPPGSTWTPPRCWSSAPRSTTAGPAGLLAVVARFAVAGLAAFPALNSRVDSDRGEVVELDGGQPGHRRADRPRPRRARRPRTPTGSACAAWTPRSAGSPRPPRDGRPPPPS
jgi:pyruvate dehydrogenase E2 component (dihydrolipoamide acetyltransferase)